MPALQPFTPPPPVQRVDLASVCPPAGASPAGDLQRRVCDAVARAPGRPDGPRWPARARLLAIAGLGVLCWAMMLAAARLLAA